MSAVATTPHRFTIRVYYEDTDAVGIVYHANYLKYAERARTELLRSLGLDHTALRVDHGLAFAVRRCVADFRKAARLDDQLCVSTYSQAPRGARIDMHQEIHRDDDLLVLIDLELALIGPNMRPKRLPEALRRVFAEVATP